MVLPIDRTFQRGSLDSFVKSVLVEVPVFLLGNVAIIPTLLSCGRSFCPCSGVPDAGANPGGMR